MRRPTTSALLILGLIITVHVGPADAQQAERFSVPGNAVAIYNLVGAVSIDAGTGANVVIEVRRGGDDANQLRLEQREVEGRPALVVRYPQGDVVYDNDRWRGRTTLTVRNDGTFFGEGDRGERITIRNSGSGTEAHADLRVLVPAGKAVFLRLGIGQVTASNVNGELDIDVAAAGVQTSNTRGNLRIDTGSGAVTVNGAEGEVSVDTGSGAVTIDGVRGNALNVDTGSGAVRGSDITTSTVHVDTGSGRIELARVAAQSLELDTGSGGVTLELTTDIERLHIDTGSGGVSVTVPPDIGATISIETGSGSIQADPPITVRSRGRDHLQGSIGDGRGSIQIETGSGGVRIVRR